MLENCRILIVEPEFLIALDMQRILEAAGATGVIPARTPSEVEAVRSQWSDFDLALLALPREKASILALARELEAAGLALVFASTEGAGPMADEQFPSAVRIGKPFAEDDLLAACRKALPRETA